MAQKALQEQGNERARSQQQHKLQETKKDFLQSQAECPGWSGPWPVKRSGVFWHKKYCIQASHYHLF